MPKDSSKPRGKMSAYAFFIQQTRADLKNRFPNESVNFAEFSKACATKWKVLTPEQKLRYNELAEQDKGRFSQEMSTYVPGPGDSRGKRKRSKKDPNAPKRPMTAFFWFSNEERANVKTVLNAGAPVGEVAKELGRRWKAIRPELKARYNTLADKDKQRHEQELKLYKNRGSTSAMPNTSHHQVPIVVNGGSSVAELALSSSSDDDDEEDEV